MLRFPALRRLTAPQNTANERRRRSKREMSNDAYLTHHLRCINSGRAHSQNYDYQVHTICMCMMYLRAKVRRAHFNHAYYALVCVYVCDSSDLNPDVRDSPVGINISTNYIQ